METAEGDRASGVTPRGDEHPVARAERDAEVARSSTPGSENVSVWLDPARCSLEDFRALVERETDVATVPLAAEVIEGIPAYEGVAIRSSLGDDERARAFMAEWNRVFADGPGILVVRGACTDTALLDEVTAALSELIEREARAGTGRGDHFAPAGANSRLWNAHEKLCIADPELFARYNANPIVPLVSRAWLGPGYQITTQVNVVRPGGQAQSCHRDYHMGFQRLEELARYPASVHRLSAALTLQGAIAHSDMPVESGPTKLLPYSQRYLPGYLATHVEAFRDYFESRFVQLPLSKGDALFFNPAVFHAAGSNRTRDVQRFANLMQIGSGYGRSIEIVDRHRMSLALYPTLAGLARAGELNAREVADVVAACAEAYPFPANLDTDSPLEGMAPPSQQDLLRRALAESWSTETFRDALEAQRARRHSH